MRSLATNDGMLTIDDDDFEYELTMVKVSSDSPLLASEARIPTHARACSNEIFGSEGKLRDS